MNKKLISASINTVPCTSQVDLRQLINIYEKTNPHIHGGGVMSSEPTAQ